MHDISDNELILFHYRDGLSAQRLQQIERALADSPALAARYRDLRRVLDAADRDPLPAPDAQFEQRLWSRLQPRLQADASVAVASVPLAHAAARGHSRPRSRRRLAWASGFGALALAIGTAMLLFPQARDDRGTPSQSQLVAQQPVAQQPAAADRALRAYVATHLRSAEGLLLSLDNNDSAALALPDDGYVQALADDNRLYAAAAARRGDKALAGFLRSLDPLLIEVANQTRAGAIEPDRGLREWMRQSDLLFQVRAVQVRLRTRGELRA